MRGDGEQYISVVSVLNHPSYNAGNGFAFDFSLLRLATSVSVPTSTTGLVCLPTGSSQLFVGTTLTISGWGTVSHGGQQSAALKSASVIGLANSVCQTRYPQVSIGSHHLCAAQANTDTCQGDSGGNSSRLISFFLF